MSPVFYYLIAAACIVFVVMIVQESVKRVREMQYKQLEADVLKALNVPGWSAVSGMEAEVTVKSRKTLEKYDMIKFFQENSKELEHAERVIQRKSAYLWQLQIFLEDNCYKSHPQYDRLKKKIEAILYKSSYYGIRVYYVTAAGNCLDKKEIYVREQDICGFKSDPSLLMGKTEYNKYVKEQQKEVLSQRHHEYYEYVNGIIDYANFYRDMLVMKDSKERLDTLVAQLFDRTINSIKKIKSIDSEEWNVIGNIIAYTQREVENMVTNNQRILDYYNSPDFLRIRTTCEALMSSQREFNEYINEKVQSISQLFGTRMVRGETINEDEYSYIRPYKKTITPFTAEVSATVFASAENNPLAYLVKYFYPNKEMYPEQIQKLHVLIEELETLREAKQIIENYKTDYRQYLGDVPAYIMENDEAGFYARLGFATIDESVLAVEYKFTYTSGGGMAQRSFAVPMTEETIVELIKLLESKLSASAFVKEQRMLMTSKLRACIKQRDNHTCCHCGNSVYKEPNLLLEIDHIIPVSRGGYTTEDNLQTLCWKCNREKSNKIIAQEKRR